MTLAARYLCARTLDTAPAHSAPPGPGEVELAPAYVGICGTDLHIFHGDMDARVSAPAVLGHEMAGRVVRCGPDVTDWRPGDAVTVMPLRWDDTCPACQGGSTSASTWISSASTLPARCSSAGRYPPP
ncbi:dehydrogenase [Streptomyces sviceus ATCC 29083]|uniref:Dehydrogenase n=1 Tax=Streptomyces sviceus (strain ATCC 29083 / DSM 924 / JCM 4929 / NBRC 13980 / NCIMB 11184 / NRRL 5439 / UC 5370) TaxID=463191 RepID=B5HUP8_STRX2|nr:dehydrogenase [Streptomyces sviceus ATCC 29083]